jgi:hypothetical protein
MSPHLERSLEALFRTRLQKMGALVFKLAPTHVGLPDRLLVLPTGRILFVELKTTTGTLSPAQRELHRRLAAHGAPVTVLYGLGEIRTWADGIQAELLGPDEEDLI